jgi:predicted TIM-barrel fold metal-dependent hydrolase
MDDAGVNVVVIQGMDVTNTDPDKKDTDEYILENYIKRDPKRFIGFSGVQSRDLQGRFVSGNLAQFVRAVTELGFKGMKALPNYGLYAPDDKSMYPFYQKAVELGVPVMLHMGTSTFTPVKYDYGHPKYLDDVLLDFPDLKICAAHMAYPWQKETLGLMRKCPNLYSDTAALTGRPTELTWNLVLAKEYNLLDRIMWATDYPLCNPKQSSDWIRNGLNAVAEKCGWPVFSDEEIEKMLGINAAKFLGLKI